MRALAIIAAALALSGCANNAALLDAAKSFVADPRCSHDDKFNAVTGAAGVPASVQISAERHCPAATSAAAAVQP